MATLREINPKQPAAEFKPIQMLVNHAVSGRQFFMLLVVAFATLGLLLAALGIYGVISYTVTRQTQEIGIRMALGASAGIVQRQILTGTLRLALIGIAIGAVASIAGARLMASILFETSPWDALTYLSMALVLLAVAALSGYVPAFPRLADQSHGCTEGELARCRGSLEDNRRFPPRRAGFRLPPPRPQENAWGPVRSE